MHENAVIHDDPSNHDNLDNHDDPDNHDESPESIKMFENVLERPVSAQCCLIVPNCA